MKIRQKIRCSDNSRTRDTWSSITKHMKAPQSPSINPGIRSKHCSALRRWLVQVRSQSSACLSITQAHSHTHRFTLCNITAHTRWPTIWLIPVDQPVIQRSQTFKWLMSYSSKICMQTHQSSHRILFMLTERGCVILDTKKKSKKKNVKQMTKGGHFYSNSCTEELFYIFSWTGNMSRTEPCL